MKIGIDIRFWNETGVGRYIRNTVSEFARQKPAHSFVLFTLSKNSDEVKRVVSGLSCKIVNADIPWHSVSEQLRFAQLIHTHAPDLMHFPYFSIPIRYNRPFVVTIHDLILHHFPTGQASTLPTPVYWGKHIAYKYIIKRAAQRAHHIIAVSQATRDEIVDHLGVPSSKITVIYEGVDTALHSSHTKALVSGSYFLHVGNVYPHKNMTVLLHAYTQLQKSHPETKLVIVGQSDYFMDRLQKESIAHHVSNIEFRGYVSDAELANLYYYAKATVIPSLMEGFSLPALEAMNNNCPVIVSDIPVHREIVDDAGIYFRVDDSNALISQLENVLTVSFDRNSLVQKAKKRVEFFSWKTSARKTLDIYENSVSI